MTDVLKKATSRKIVIEPGEEKLHKAYNFKSKPGKEVTVIVGEDGGSTQVRVAFVDKDDMDNFAEALNDLWIIPAVSATVPDDRVIVDKGQDLFDLMDSTIINLSGKNETLFKQARLVRGTKFVDVELKENRLKSSTQKTSDPTFYFNLIDCLAYAICQKYENEIPEKVNVYWSVALPPDDMNERNMERFREILSAFKWTHNPSGVSLSINVKAVRASTEPEAFVKAFYALSDRVIPDYCLHIEGGGRSMGVELLIRGNSLATGQKTLDYGGSQLLDSISGLYVAKNGGAPLKRQVLEESVRKGTVRIGNEVRDVTDIIRQAKADIGGKIVNDIVLQVFDQQTKVSLSDLNVISVSGRLFESTPVVKTDDAGNTEVVDQISLATFVNEGFSRLTPSTEFLHIEGNFIPAGLLILAIVEFFAEDDSNVGNGQQAQAQLEAAPASDEATNASSEGISVTTEGNPTTH